MSDSGDERQQQGTRRRRGGGNNNSDEKELASQLVQVASKRFYIDVKENDRGRFIKLAEVGVGGRRSRILMTMPAASEFKARLQEFSELHASLGPEEKKAEENGPASTEADSKEGDDGSKKRGSQSDQEGLIKSEIIVQDRKRYYLDFKENSRGRFLRVSQVVSVPTNRGSRAYLAIPAQGLVEFQEQLTDMLERYGGEEIDEDGFNNTHNEPGNNDMKSSDPKSYKSNVGETQNHAQVELPEAKFFRGGNKSFYFDGGSNPRGSFLKISEVRQNRYRTSITVSHEYVKQFRDQLNGYIESMSALGLDQDNHDQKKMVESEEKN